MNKFEPCSYTYHLTIDCPIKITVAKGPKIGIIRTESPKNSTTDSKPTAAERTVFNAFARKPSIISAKPSQANPIQKKPHVGMLKIK